MRFGDRVRIEMLDAEGRSIFGAIDQKVRVAGLTVRPAAAPAVVTSRDARRRRVGARPLLSGVDPVRAPLSRASSHRP